MRRLPTKRLAYTLTELLVVIALLVVLGSLGLGAASKGYGWVKQRATETTMTKVALRLQRRIEQIYKEAEDWPGSTENIMLLEAAGSPERAHVLKVLYLYKWSFPNTYAEAFHNVQESRILYDPSGYPPARALLGRLAKGYSGIPDPFSVPATTPWPGGTPPIANMPTAIPAQSSACMLAAYAAANGSTDEFGADELTTANSVPGDNNLMLVDAWGTPYMFMRHGNFIHSRHRVGAGGVDRAAHWMGMVPVGVADPLDFAPLEFVLNPRAVPAPATWPAQTPLVPGPLLIPPGWPQTPQPPNGGNASLGVTAYYFAQIQQRAMTSFGVLTSTVNQVTTGRDPFDPTAQLKNNIAWRTAFIDSTILPFDGWLDPGQTPWLGPLGAGTPPQYVSLFRRTFGYCPEIAPTIQNYQNQAFTPFVILSAGGDKIFSNWDDNLDSYRLKLNVPSQQ